jgi:hypothetical protein
MSVIKQELKERPVQITVNTMIMLCMGAITFICQQALQDIRGNEEVNALQNLQLARLMEHLSRGTRYTGEDAKEDFGNVAILVNSNSDGIEYNRESIRENNKDIQELRLRLVVLEDRSNDNKK